MAREFDSEVTRAAPGPGQQGPVPAAFQTFATSALQAPPAVSGRAGIELAPGDIVKGRFEVVEELGRGGMGLVYKARDLRKVEARDPDPFVAMKILSGDMAEFGLGFVALQREGKHAQSLNHPNIVKVFDFDRDGKLVYLTMELLRGEPLQLRLRDADRPLDAAERLRIARGIISGLGYAHAQGLVHADIKPSNVFLGEDGEPKLLDFGIARARERDSVFDADDVGAMTMDYASPEMLAGERPQPADDVYALGCLLFRLYAGRHPFDHVPADQAASQRLRPKFPANLTRVQSRAVARALAFRRADRFEDAMALGRAFDAYDWRRLGLGLAGAALAAVLALWSSSDWLLARWGTLQLDADQRAQVEAAVREGQGNLARRYWEDAALQFVEALRLNPYNREARAGLVAVVADMRGAMPAVDLPDAIAVLQERTRCLGDDPQCPRSAKRILARAADRHAPPD